MPQKGSAIIHFTEHKSAKQAKELGKVVNPRIPPIGQIFYSQVSPGKGRRPTKSDDKEDSQNPDIPLQSKPLKRATFSITKALKTTGIGNLKFKYLIHS